MKKVACCVVNKDNSGALNAGTKAVSDVNRILTAHGFVTHLIYERTTAHLRLFSLRKLTQALYQVLAIARCTFMSDVIVYQFPCCGYRALHFLTLLIRLSRTRKIAVVHDLDYLRPEIMVYVSEHSILKFLLAMDELIVHTPEMKRHLISKGLAASSMHVLYDFDYLTTSQNAQGRDKKGNIVFAGNLNKSAFLQNLCVVKISNISYNLYGMPPMGKSLSGNVFYCGKFDSDDISQIKGGWGLVWDGDSCTTCSGDLGAYLAYNSPHKISLYIAAELPIIIWRGAAMADYIVKKSFGIAIDSLSNLEEAINSVSEETYSLFQEALHNERELISRGERLSSILSKMNI